MSCLPCWAAFREIISGHRSTHFPRITWRPKIRPIILSIRYHCWYYSAYFGKLRPFGTFLFEIKYFRHSGFWGGRNCLFSAWSFLWLRRTIRSGGSLAHFSNLQDFGFFGRQYFHFPSNYILAKKTIMGGRDFCSWEWAGGGPGSWLSPTQPLHPKITAKSRGHYSYLFKI